MSFIRLLGLAALSCSTINILWAGPPIRFGQLFQRADTVLVGSLESAKRPSQGKNSSQPSTVADNVTVSCEVTMQISAVIRTVDPTIVAGITRNFIWQMRSSSQCDDTASEFKTLKGHFLLLLLQFKNGVLHAVEDRPLSARELLVFPREVKTRTDTWKDPGLAVAYLLLKPGVYISDTEYASSDGASRSAWEMWPVIGKQGELIVYRQIYLESNEAQRRNISLAVSSSGLCVDAAKKAALAEGTLDRWAKRRPFFDQNTLEMADEDDLRSMQWTNKDEVLRTFNNISSAAIDNLIFLACSSKKRVKARARQVLQDYFDIDPSTLPCIPCE